MRRQLSHAFSDRALRGQEAFFQKDINKLIQRLMERVRKGEAVDIVSWYNLTTFDIMGDLAFGEPFGGLDTGGYHPWVATVLKPLRYGSIREVMGQYKLLKPIIMALTPNA